MRADRRFLLRTPARADRRFPARTASWFAASLRIAVACIALTFAAAHPAHAQLGFLMPGAPTSAQDSSAAAASQMSPESPRASLVAFIQLTERHNYEQAAQYLDVPAALRARAPELARRLRDVLDQRLWIVIGRVSPLSVGDTADGNELVDRLGVIPGASGLPEPVLFRRFDGDRIRRWRFDQETVANIDGWYEELPDAWLRGRLPAPLLRQGPLGLHYWQWLGMLIAISASVLLAALFTLGLRFMTGLVVARTVTNWDDLLVARLRGPFRLWFVGVLMTPLFGMLGLNARVSGFVTACARGIVVAALFWGVLRIIALIQDRLLRSSWASGQSQARTLVPLLTRFLYVTIMIVALLVVLAQFGYPVGALLAGVGIGGVALALASQKTVEHLFGSISLAADKVFRVGDVVRVGDVEGTVERIGLRSTSIRKSSRTVVRIPNGRLAEDRIETFGPRDRFLMQHDLRLDGSTTPEQLRAVVKALETRLNEHPALWAGSVVVRVTGFTDSAILVRMQALFDVSTHAEFLEAQHETLLAAMDIIAAAGAKLAFPSRSMLLVGPDGETPPPPAAPSAPSSPAPPPRS